MAGRCGLEDYARRCVRCRVPKHADSSSAAELDARLSLPVPNEVTLRARAREERCARVMHQRFPVVQQLSVATDRRRSIYFEACANGNRVYKIRKSTETRSQKKIVYGTRYQDFFFSLGRLGFLKSAFLRKNFRETTNRRVTFGSAQHDTHQLTPCRFSSRLVRPSPVFPSRTPCNLRFTSTAARPPPASRSTFPRRIVASSTARQFRPLAHSRLARRPRATAR